MSEVTFRFPENAPDLGPLFEDWLTRCMRESSLFEVVTTECGESYVRAFVWSESEDSARVMFAEKHPGKTIAQVYRCFGKLDAPFCSALSDSGFPVMESK